MMFQTHKKQGTVLPKDKMMGLQSDDPVVTDRESWTREEKFHISSALLHGLLADSMKPGMFSIRHFLSKAIEASQTAYKYEQQFEEIEFREREAKLNPKSEDKQ